MKPPPPPFPEDPDNAVESAPLARWVAERLCREDPHRGESCSWYHGFRPFLRALGLAVTPAHHADFLRRAFRLALEPGRRARVLVSGAIDESMFAHVVWAAREAGAAVDVTVVDICETPLFLNLWFSRRSGIPVATICSDILSLQAPEPFDLICTNAFFGQFDARQRPALIRRWHALLNPGGRVITVAPVRRGSGTEPVGFTPAEAGSLRATIVASAQAADSASTLGACPTTLAQFADTFTARMKVHPLVSEDAIADLFEAGRFRLDHLSTSSIHDHLSLTDPTVSRSAEYAQVIARRP